MDGCGKDYLILISFRLSQISCFTLSLKCFFFDSDNCLDVGIRSLLQFPNQPRARPVLLTLPFLPLVPSAYWVLHRSIYSFKIGQVLVTTLSWCSACTSVSEGVFLIYPWTEMYSMSTYFSAILFYLYFCFCKLCAWRCVTMCAHLSDYSDF